MTGRTFLNTGGARCAMGHRLILSLESGERTVHTAMPEYREFRYEILTELCANGSAPLSTLMREKRWRQRCAPVKNVTVPWQPRQRTRCGMPRLTAKSSGNVRVGR